MASSRVPGVVVVVGMLMAACFGSRADAAADEKSVVLFAAASTGHAIDEIKAAFEQETGIRVQTSYAGTSTLAQQVVNGAEADVFLSANVKWADFLADKGLVQQRQRLLGNRLVVVVPSGSRLVLSKPDDLLAAAVAHLALADPEGVPAGIYARQALSKLGLWERLKAKVAAADDVQHALAFVETGAAEAGFVYSTDAAASRKVKVALEIDSGLTGAIEYPVLLMKHGASRSAAERFYQYLASPKAKEVFEKHGFVWLGAPPRKP